MGTPSSLLAPSLINAPLKARKKFISAPLEMASFLERTLLKIL